VCPTDAALVHALAGHVETLKAQLAEETAALREHNATLKAELEHPRRRDRHPQGRTELRTRRRPRARQRGKRQAAQAIAAFEGLAKRLEAKAWRPSWRRWLGLAG
jgi:hypothetical protein